MCVWWRDARRCVSPCGSAELYRPRCLTRRLMLGDVLGGAGYLDAANSSVALRARYTAASVRGQRRCAPCDEVVCDAFELRAGVGPAGNAQLGASLPVFGTLRYRNDANVEDKLKPQILSTQANR